MKCGFKIGGGIDQDFTKSPQGYTDNVRLGFKTYCSYNKLIQFQDNIKKFIDMNFFSRGYM